MATLNSNTITATVNRPTISATSPSTTIEIYEKGTKLTAVNSTPGNNQYKITISSTKNCTCLLGGDYKTITVSKITSSSAEIVISINIENRRTYTKTIPVAGITDTTVIKTMSTEQKQLANKFSWLVKSGTSSSNMQLTSDALKVIAKNIDLTGKVTFNSLDNATQTKFNSTYSRTNDAYNRVAEWANGAISGSTTIKGGMIETGTITAKQLYLGDMTNYCNLSEQTASLYGFTAQNDNSGTWYKLNTNNRDICISGNKKNDFGYYKCNGGESFRIKYQMKSNVKGSSSGAGTDSAYVYVNIGIYGKNSSGNYFYAVGDYGKLSESTLAVQSCNYTIKLPNDARTFGVFLQLTAWGNWSGSCYIRNVEVTKMASGELIVDGAITADKLAANAITGKTITGGIINGTVINGSSINSDSFNGDMLAIDGTISANSLDVDVINNAKYPATITEDIKVYVDATNGDDDNSFESGVTFASFDRLFDVMPKNLNGHTVDIQLLTDVSENVSFTGFYGGRIRVYFSGHTLYGYFRSHMSNAKIYAYGGYIGQSNVSDMTWGAIHPYKGVSVASKTASVSCQDTGCMTLYRMDIYGSDNNVGSNTVKVGVAADSYGMMYLSEVAFYNCDIGGRANAGARIHDNLSYGVCGTYGFESSTGAIVSLVKNNHAGGLTANTNKTNTGQLWIDDGAKYSTGEQQTSPNTAPTTKTTKTVTIKSNSGDTYRSTVYNNWKKDGTVRQGDYGYGDCNGCWFFGNQLSQFKGKNISKVVITVTRQSGGQYAAVNLTLKTHNYASRPSGAPSYVGSIGTLSLAVGSSGSKTITDTSNTIIAGLKAGTIKGIGLQSSYTSALYAVCSGSCTLKITYTE